LKKIKQELAIVECSDLGISRCQYLVLLNNENNSVNHNHIGLRAARITLDVQSIPQCTLGVYELPIDYP
jgi:predicted NUDIX family phosphoesterase